ncbi:hypothetical protein FA95DRAFT_780446 [Auriscalpium vulgare]|uniref:Uncharacterized protein n=1 Tax=Auriscalpium vulgare TaxID=40419 RepID=A0ACB8RAM5_9AGAM|nr:hypothetical protein FA95DRAFT_780446 [Auriscalpium vulgare]
MCAVFAAFSQLLATGTIARLVPAAVTAGTCIGICTSLSPWSVVTVSPSPPYIDHAQDVASSPPLMSCYWRRPRQRMQEGVGVSLRTEWERASLRRPPLLSHLSIDSLDDSLALGCISACARSLRDILFSH